MSGTGRLLAATFVLSSLGCRSLPSIPEDVCGNGVIEAPEDCDGFPRGGIECRPPGDAAECRLDCSPRPNGERGPCPPRWGCDGQFTCRPPSGGFRQTPAPIAGNAWSVALGDFDGDGRDDVMGQEPTGSLGFTKIRLHYLDEQLAHVKTWAPQKTLATPNIMRFADDERSGLVFSDFRINIWLGQSNGSLIPGTYSTYYFPNTRTRALSLGRGLVSGVTALLLLTEENGRFGMFRADPAIEQLIEIAELPGGLDDLSGEPAIGDLFEDDRSYPCNDVAIAHRGALEVQIYSVCERGEDGAVAWRRVTETRGVATEPPTPLDGGLLIADIDGDGHQDLLVGGQGSGQNTLFVAYGDGERLEVARPLMATLEPGDRQLLSMPLAAGDVTNDGLAELIYPQTILRSRRSAEETPVFVSVHGRFRAPWSVARIGDFNGNGHADIVAASVDGVDIDFFNGTGGDELNPFTIPTTYPVRHVSVGDVDGDLLDDLVLSQVSAFGEEDEVAVAFGSQSGPPNEPVPVAHVHGVQQITTFVNDEEDGAADLVLLYDQEDREGNTGSALAVLDGAGDRSLPCAVELTSFSANDSLVAVPSIGVTVGTFVQKGTTDALALALTCDPISDGCDLSDRKPELWLLPDLASKMSAPERLGWGLEPEFATVSRASFEEDVRVTLAAGDFDGDGLDEAVLVGPSRRQCLLATASVAAHGETRVLLRSTIRLPDPCTRDAAVRVEDVDDDGAKDILLLTGQADGSPRLRVLWNEGGGFDPARSLEIATSAQSPRAFTSYRPSASERLRIAVATMSRVRFFDSQGPARSFVEARVDLELELQFPTGIAAGDLDGDGVFDLAIADAGSIRLLHAELERR